LRIFFSDYSERHVLNNTTEDIEDMVQLYAGREDVVMRLTTYIEKYEPHLSHIAQKTLEDHLGREDKLLLDISRWEESWMKEALGVPNSAGGAVGGAAEHNTSALGFPNSAGGAAGGAAEDNTSAMDFPNSAGGAADSARTGRRLDLNSERRRSSRNVAAMPSGPDAFSNIVKDAKTSADKKK
jgi:hypothetical protein